MIRNISDSGSWFYIHILNSWGMGTDWLTDQSTEKSWPDTKRLEGTSYCWLHKVATKKKMARNNEE